MILPDNKIREMSYAIKPFNDEQVNPASYDLRLGCMIRTPMWYWRRPYRWLAMLYDKHVKRLRKWGESREFIKHTLMPGDFVLCHSMERTTIPADIAAFLFLKSSAGRIGLEHLHSGYGDPGFSGQWSFEITNSAPWPVLLTAGKRLMQLVFMEMDGVPDKLYGDVGRYQNQIGPTKARNEIVVHDLPDAESADGLVLRPVGSHTTNPFNHTIHQIRTQR